MNNRQRDNRRALSSSIPAAVVLGLAGALTIAPAALSQVTPAVGVPSKITLPDATPPAQPPTSQSPAPPAANPTPNNDLSSIPPATDINARREWLRQRLNADSQYLHGVRYSRQPAIQTSWGRYAAPSSWVLGRSGLYGQTSDRGTIWTSASCNSIHNGRVFFPFTGTPVDFRIIPSRAWYPNLPYRTRYWVWADVAQQTGPDDYFDHSAIVTGNGYPMAPLTTPLSSPSASPDAAQPAVELTDLEKADAALRASDAAGAIVQLRSYLKDHPEDATVMRVLAISLIDDRKVDQAIAVMMSAMEKQPTLARDPLDASWFSGGQTAQRTRFTKVMEFANRQKTGSALLTAAVLAQSEGRPAIAKGLIDRAAALGTSAEVIREMNVALGVK